MNKILGSLMTVGAVSIMIGAGAFAAFSATASNTGNVFTTGTLNLLLTPATGLFSITNMKPGDSVTRNITVNNTGSLNMTYNATDSVTATDAVLNETVNGLQLSVETGGTLIWGPLPLNTFSLSSRPVAAGAFETLNFTVSLPSTANNTAQNQTANVTFTFNAAQ